MLNNKKLNFEYPEDKQFFADILATGDINKLDTEFYDYFDFRDPEIKRKEFNLIRKKILPALMERDKCKCQLNLPGCEIDKNINVDHLVPLSSNKLNRKIRGQKSNNGKKPKTQSFGSNNIKNLVISCGKCNAIKKHRIMDFRTRELI